MATDNMYRKFCEVWTRGLQADRQTHKRSSQMQKMMDQNFEIRIL